MASWWPFKKEEKKSKRAFAGARMNRTVADWVAQGTSADSEIKGSLRGLRNRARQLERDNDFVRQYLRAVQNNVIGQGIPFQAQVRMQRGNKLNDAMNDQIEKAWYQWTKKDSCHTAGRLSFCDLERLLVRSVARDGEIFVRLVNQKFGSSKVPLALEVLEADLLDDDKSGQAPNGNEIRMGVEFDKWGRPTAYYFHERHPGDYQFANHQVTATRGHRRIPAEDIIPLFLQERPHQTRGFSWLASAMTRLHQLQGYEEATVIKARISASLMGFITSPEGELKGDDVEGVDRVTDMSPGLFSYLAPGENVTVPDMGEPPTQYDAFVTATLRAVASGAGVSYETLSRDYSRSNYSSSRLALLDDRDHWRVLQKWMIENFHRVVFERWLDMAQLSGAVSLPGYEADPERYRNVKWMPRGWSWVDPQKEVDAYKAAVRAGFMTVGDVVSQAGGDLEELMVNREREVQLAKDKGLVFDTDPMMVSNAGLTQARPQGSVVPDADGTTPQGVQDPSPGLTESQS